MEHQRVKDAVGLLHARGEKVTTHTVRAVIGRGSNRDIQHHLKILLGEVPPDEEPRVPEEAQGVPTQEARMVIPQPHRPLTLLEEAEQRLATARSRENATKLAYDLETESRERERLRSVFALSQRERMGAATRLEQLQAAKDRVALSIQEGRRALRYAEAELERAKTKAHREIAYAQRQVKQAQEDLNRMLANLVTIAGGEAIPPETAS